MKKLIWLDDCRDPYKNPDWLVFSPIGKDVEVVWCKSYDEFVQELDQNGLPDKMKAVIFDLDRTLMYRNGRDIYDYESAGTDTIDPKGLELVKSFIKSGIEVIISTGREITEKSLDAIHTSMQIDPIKKMDGEYYPYIVLGRPVGCRLKSAHLKNSNLQQAKEMGYDIIAAFDDDEECVDMYRRFDIFACKIN